MRKIAQILTLSLLCSGISFGKTANKDSGGWEAVEAAMGRTGVPQEDGSYKFGLPRSDLKVTVDGVVVKPAFALGSWVAFTTPSTDTMMMGDLVLAENEVAAVMSRLLENGVEVTALHHHVLQQSPRIMYMHVYGHGDAVKLATAVKQAVALTKTPAATRSAMDPASPEIDVASIEQTLGHKGKINGGVLQVEVPRAEPVTENGMKIPDSMNVGTTVNFQPTGGGKAAINGDFALLGSEVSTVAKALRENGIQVTALHSHMLNEQPRLLFLHFWANDDAVKLAKGLRAALDHTNSAR